VGLAKVKTNVQLWTDVEVQRHGIQIGLETLVVHAEIDEC